MTRIDAKLYRGEQFAALQHARTQQGRDMTEEDSAIFVSMMHRIWNACDKNGARCVPVFIAYCENLNR